VRAYYKATLDEYVISSRVTSSIRKGIKEKTI
jgi:hypothetical protein